MYYLLCVVGVLLSFLPDRILVGVSRGFAFFAYRVLRFRRRTVLKNLRLAFGTNRSAAELDVLGSEVYINFFLTIFEFFCAARRDIVASVEYCGRENLTGAIAGGRGCFILCGHLGNWEALGAGVSRHIAPAHVLVKKVGSGGVNRFVSAVREKNGFLSIKRRTAGDGYRSVLRAISSGQVVGFVGDQSRPGEPRLPFFGHPAKTNTSLAQIQRRLDVPVVPGYIERTGFGKHRAHFLPPLALTRSDDAKRDVEENTTRFNAALESMIRSRPEQYLWLHDRWKA